MGRWIRQTDTMIIVALAVGLFVFRFGDESWAAVSPHLIRAQNTLSAQLDRVTTSVVSSTSSVEAEVAPNAPVVGSSQVTSFQGTTFQGRPSNPLTSPRSQTRLVVQPGCPGGHPYRCQY